MVFLTLKKAGEIHDGTIRKFIARVEWVGREMVWLFSGGMRLRTFATNCARACEPPYSLHVVRVGKRAVNGTDERKTSFRRWIQKWSMKAAWEILMSWKSDFLVMKWNYSQVGDGSEIKFSSLACRRRLELNEIIIIFLMQIIHVLLSSNVWANEIR